MMEDDNPADSSASLAEEELEFRPWVKWCGMGLAGAASIGFFLLTYYVGYGQGEEAGFIRATGSGVVQQSLNAAASQNLLNFMRLASASDEHLLAVAADTAAAFSWVKEPEVRQEAEWCLANALLDRRLVNPATKMLEGLFSGIPQSAEWAYRLLRTADGLASMQQYETAAKYYKQAADFFAAIKQQEARLLALGQLISLEICSPGNGEQAIQTLQSRFKELEASGDAARPLRAVLQVQMGLLYRSQGKQAEALQMFKSAVEGVDTAATTQPIAAVSYGTALLEQGDIAAAEPLLRQAAGNNGNKPSDIASRLLALRQLAIIEHQKGHIVTAQALLHRAQGVAEGRVLPGNMFWPCLYDQRGWLHYIVQNYQTALLDFTAAMGSTQDALLLVQPQEGAARCYLELGKPAEAQVLLENCLKLRNQHAASDKQAIGRVNLLLGQIYDQQGKAAEAEAAYGIAVANHPGDSPEEVENRTTALLGRAYVLADLQRWSEAYDAWQQVLPLLESQHDRREEARAQMRRIKPLIPAEPNAEAQQ